MPNLKISYMTAIENVKEVNRNTRKKRTKRTKRKNKKVNKSYLISFSIFCKSKNRAVISTICQISSK